MPPMIDPARDRRRNSRLPTASGNGGSVVVVDQASDPPGQLGVIGPEQLFGRVGSGINDDGDDRSLGPGGHV